MIERRAWTREELILAIALYCKTPFGKIHSRNQDIIDLSYRLNRTPSSIAMKMTNFASLDPTLDRSGMKNFSKLDKEVWDEFFENIDGFLEQFEKIDSYTSESEEAKKDARCFKEGTDYYVIAKARKNQDFFRDMVVSSYDNKCALTGIDATLLLVASHIVPWSVNVSIRTDPRNGICLNALHDKAFDAGLITFSENYSMIVSNATSEHSKKYLERHEGRSLRLPSRFLPSPEFLKYHRENVFLA